MMEWISVEDRLPNELTGHKNISYLCSENVLVYDSEDDEVMVLFYDYDSYRWDSNRFDDEFLDNSVITHWQPLPLPPKEEEEEPC